MDDYERRNAQEWSMEYDSAAKSLEPETDDENDEDLIATAGTHHSFSIPFPTSRVFGGLSNGGDRVGEYSSTTARQKPASHASRGQPSSFAYERDNHAKAAWRRRKQHDDSFSLPGDYHAIILSEHGKKTMKKDDYPAGLCSIFEDVGMRTGTYIRPPISLHDSKLLIWGNPSQVKAAKHAMNERINLIRSEILRSNKGKGMPSVHSMTIKARKEYEMRMYEDGRKLKFRQEPEENVQFGVVGAYMWPHDEFQPEDILGPNYEALDPIRMFGGCYIVYEHETSVFKILSDSHSQVANAMTSIGNVVCEFATRSSALERYFVDPPKTSSIKDAVKVVDVPWYKPKPGRIEREPLLAGKISAGEHPCRFFGDLERSNKAEIQYMSLRCLRRMRYYRGRIHMRVQFGIFTLNKYLWLPEKAPSIPVKTFVENMRLPDTIGTLHQFLPAKQHDDLFAFTSGENTLFEPIDADTERLEDVVPSYVALFTFALSNNMPIKLQIEANAISGKEAAFQLTFGKWYRENGQKPFPLRLFIIRLDGGTTWGLQISVDNNIEATRLESSLTEFTCSVSCKKPRPNSGPGSGESVRPVFNFVWHPMLREFIQKTSRRYRLRVYGIYVFEVTRYDTFDAKDRRLLHTKWSTSLYNESWDQIFAENVMLKIGDVAKWNPSQEAFFPSNQRSPCNRSDGGFAGFLTSIQSVVGFLNKERAR